MEVQIERRHYSVVVDTVYHLSVDQLTQGWKIKAANLRPLADEAAALIQTLGRYDPSAALGTGLVKVPRDEIVRVLGH